MDSQRAHALNRRRTIAVVLLATAALTLSTRSFVTFDRLRLKLVQSAAAPDADGAIHITTTDLNQLAALGQPIALIAHLSSEGDADRDLKVSVDGTPVCSPHVAAGNSRRVDCVVTMWRTNGPHQVRVSGPPAGWALTYLELATHHGHTSGANYLVILPRDSSHYRPASAMFVLVSTAALAGLLFLIPAAELPKWGRRAHVVLSGVVIVVIAAVLSAPWISSYQIIVWAWTFLLWLAILAIRHVWTIVRWLLAANVSLAGRWVYLARALIIALATLAVFRLVMLSQLQQRYDGNYSGFLTISRAAFDANPLVNARDDIRRSLRLLDGVGYDGQYLYFMTFDPLMRAFPANPAKYRSVVDTVPYRYGRIGFSALTRLFAGSRATTYPATMVWLVVASIGATAFALAILAQDGRLSPAWGALVILVPGFWRSLDAGLPEPVAAAALVAGVLCVARRRWVLAGGLFAFSLLVRETGIVLVAAVAGAVVLSGRRREGFTIIAVAVAPIAIWRLYVGWTIFPDWGLRGFFDDPADLGWPFGGFIELWSTIRRGDYFPGAPSMARAGVAYPLLLTGALLVAGGVAVRARSAVSTAAVSYAIVAVCLNFRMIWVHVGNGERGTYELFLALILCTLDVRDDPPFLRRALVAFWCAAAAYVFYAGYEADPLRRVLALPG